jgi:hypothetical protein
MMATSDGGQLALVVVAVRGGGLGIAAGQCIAIGFITMGFIAMGFIAGVR